MAVVFPNDPVLDDIVVDPITGAMWRWDGVKWTILAGGGGVTGGGNLPRDPTRIGVGAILPGDGEEGNLFWQTSDDRLYLYLDNQWVIVTTPGGDGGGGWPAEGVIDGSSAEPGEVGETFLHQRTFNGITASARQVSVVYIANAGDGIAIPRGDWEVTLTAGFNWIVANQHFDIGWLNPVLQAAVPGEFRVSIQTNPAWSGIAQPSVAEIAAPVITPGRQIQPATTGSSEQNYFRGFVQSGPWRVSSANNIQITNLTGTIDLGPSPPGLATASSTYYYLRGRRAR